MGLRPHVARWFEVLIPREEMARAAEALARTGVVEFEVSDAAAVPFPAEVGDLLERFEWLEQRYAPYWPNPASPTAAGSLPALALERALQRLENWLEEAREYIERLEALQNEHEQLSLLQRVVKGSAGPLVDAGLVARAGPVLAAALLKVDADLALPEPPSSVLCQRLEGEGATLVWVLGSPDEVQVLGDTLSSSGAQRVPLPAWLEWPTERAHEQLNARLRAVDAEQDGAQLELRRISATWQVAEAVGEVRRLRWYLSKVPRSPHTRHFGGLRGWTSDLGGERLQAALETSGVLAMLDFPPAPEDREPPVLLRNPRWARPFERIAALLGVPARYEADPSVVLGFVVPLLFGFMFGDVGQGLVLVGLGLGLGGRFPPLRLLFSGGLAACVFGVLFGSVFASEALLPALWIRPLAEPVTVLLVSVVGGAGLLLLGLLLSGLGASWRGLGRDWVFAELPIIVLYAALWALLWDLRAGFLMAVALTWHLVGMGRRSLAAGAAAVASAVASALGYLLEKLFQLGLHTVSFARVGAFALAHAGLSAAIEGMASTVESPGARLLIFVLGNAFAILLEGLVVGIQTTRLVLFEFFLCFLRGEGRAFRPLRPPEDDQTERGIEP